jgi:D-3-phosphoglycerate dehydrogenase
VHVAGTLFGKQAKPRIVGINEHTVDLPPASHMLVVRNSDTPGMIGTVGSFLGDAGVNIADMDVGTNIAGEAALMAVSTYSPVPEDVVDRIRAVPGVLEAKAIELG